MPDTTHVVEYDARPEHIRFAVDGRELDPGMIEAHPSFSYEAGASYVRINLTLIVEKVTVTTVEGYRETIDARNGTLAREKVDAQEQKP